MTTTTSRSKTIPIVGIVFAAIAGILILAVALGGGDSADSAEEFGQPQITGSLPLMPRQTPLDTSATGLDAPVVIGQDFAGNTVTIENDGTAKALVFLAHWCPHCQAEVPRVQEWLDATGGVPGVEVYSVATSNDRFKPNHPPSAWLSNEGWTAPVVLDDQDSSVLLSYGAGGFPFWVFIDDEGKVAFRTTGETTIPQLEQFMLALVEA